MTSSIVSQKNVKINMYYRDPGQMYLKMGVKHQAEN